jgi:hypothetical protein
MPDPISRLSVALSGRYRIERELGRGGMANVYRADDLRTDARSRVKVLQPELAATLGAERFLARSPSRRICSIAHILPLHDSGAADGLLFYVMPLRGGESLRERLAREKQLSDRRGTAFRRRDRARVGLRAPSRDRASGTSSRRTSSSTNDEPQSSRTSVSRSRSAPQARRS